MADQLVFYHNPMSRGRISHGILQPRPTFQNYIERSARRKEFQNARTAER